MLVLAASTSRIFERDKADGRDAKRSRERRQNVDDEEEEEGKEEEEGRRKMDRRGRTVDRGGRGEVAKDDDDTTGFQAVCLICSTMTARLRRNICLRSERQGRFLVRGRQLGGLHRHRQAEENQFELKVPGSGLGMESAGKRRK